MSSSFNPSNREDDTSQLPALQMLQNMGFTYLSPSQALELRGGRRSNLLLEPILRAQLESLNRIEWAGQTHAWSESNISNGIRRLKDLPFRGLSVTNADLTDLLLLGATLPQTIEGDTRSHTLEYVDWNPKTWATRNAFHVSEEFEVERTGSVDTRRPDLVLFVNGIPFAVIECKSAKEGVAQGVSQNIRNQGEDHIPALFTFTQLLLSIAQNDARYATTGTSAKFWSVWKEKALENDISGGEPSELAALVRRPLSKDAKDRMFAHRTQAARTQFEALETTRLVSAQDRALYALCRPERLLELAHDYTLFDAGEKKVARYQQYFLVKNLLERIQKRDPTDAQSGTLAARRGGVVWHTQGSGKSLTMVMLAKALARLGLPNAKIVLVTDRVELDGQILGTFDSCDIEVVKAPNGEKLAEILAGGRSQVVTTTIHKFAGAVAHGLKLDNSNIFVLVDEAHRSQFGEFYGRMKQALPTACYVGFTGTPIKTKEKDSINKFGGLIQPVYTIRQRVRFSTYDLLKRLGWGDSSERYEDVIHAFRRLSGVRLFAQNVLRAVPGRPEMFTFGESGSSIIGHYHLRHEQLLAPPQRPLPGRLAQGPGFEAGAGFNEEGEVNMALFPDEPGASADCSHFSWSLPVQELLRAGQLRTLSLEFALSLKRPTALRLARYLGKKAFDGKEAFEIGLARLCGMHMGMTTTPHDSVMQQRLKAAHEELIARNFITKVEFSEMKSQDGQKVRYEFGPRAYPQSDRTGTIENAPAPPEEQIPLPFEGKVDASSTSSTSTDSPASSGKAAPGANADEELLAPLVARMEAIGVSTVVARELLALVGTSEVEMQLACLDEREPRDWAATFVKATREMWSPPAAYRERIEAKVREEERVAASEEAGRRRVAEREHEQRESERQAHENAGLDALWDKLEEPTRDLLEREAIERLGILGRTGRAQAALAVMRRAVLRERLGQLQESQEPEHR